MEVKRAIIEKLSPDFLCDDFKIEQQYPIYRGDISGLRIYVKVYDDDVFIYGAGTTSILHKVMPESYFLSKWKSQMSAQYGFGYVDWYLVNSAAYGTFYHIICSKLLNGETIYIEEQAFFSNLELFCRKNKYDFNELLKWYKQSDKDYEKDIASFVQFIKDYKIKPIAIEYQFVTNHEFEDFNVYYSGTIDLVCHAEIDGEQKVILIDLKTSNGFYESHEAQLHLYMRAWNNESIHNVLDGFRADCCYNFSPKKWRKKPTYNFKDQTLSKEKDNIDLYLRLFNNNNDLNTKYSYIDTNKISIDTDIDSIIVERDIIKDILEIKNGETNEIENK